MNQFDPLAVCKAVVLRIEIAALIEFRLRTLVIDHRVHAVFIRQGEIKQLQLDGYSLLPTIRVYCDGPGIDACGKISIGVDLDPSGLILIRFDAQWKSAKTSTCIFRNELHWLPSDGI